jgi:Flp pilus assembly protein TadG
MSVISRFRRFWGEDRGAVAIEFGLVISALIVILTGCFEASRYILLHQKLDRASASVADLVSQSNTMSAAMLTDIYFAADEQTLPFDLGTRGRVIVSSVYRPNTDTEDGVVQWQCEGGGAYGAAASRIGAKDDEAVMPNTFSVGVGENVIVAEVFYDYEPFLIDWVFKPSVLYHATYARPRGTLFLTDPGC